MKIWVIGANGNMGGRYADMCRAMGHTVIGTDVHDDYPLKEAYDRAIVACITGMHMHYCRLLEARGQPYLCEKPVTMASDEIQELERLSGHMVCNWAFVHAGAPKRPGRNLVYYRNSYTGPHGLRWDCIQLYHLARNNRPNLGTGENFVASINRLPVYRNNITLSYKRMFKEWLNDSPYVWTIASTHDTHQLLNCYQQQLQEA